MLKKLARLYDVLSKRESGILVYQIVITYLPDDQETSVPATAIIQVETTRTDGGGMSYKYGDVTDNFDFNRYLNECLEDLAKESK